MKDVRDVFVRENDTDNVWQDELNTVPETDSELVSEDEIDILPKREETAMEEQAGMDQGADDHDADDHDAVDDGIVRGNISDIVKNITKSIDKDSEMALNVEKEIQEILSLSPDEPFRKMMDEVLGDPKLSTHEKITEMQRVVTMRSEDREKSATVVQEVQSSKTKSFRGFLGAFGEWIFLGGIVIVCGGLACTPGGREVLKLGAQYMVKRVA